jgi:hypothetical protein
MAQTTTAERPQDNGSSIHLERRKALTLYNKAANTEVQDRVGQVIDKLSVLDDLLAMYWVAREKVEFQDKSINGLSLIISDCVKELEDAVIS